MNKDIKIEYTKEDFKRLKQIHSGMLQRCYNKNNPSYSSYGGRGVTVCDEWRYDSQAFIEWSMENGYIKGFHLEKDIGSRILLIEPPIYSPETCIYTPPSVNNAERRKIKKEKRKSNMTVKLVPNNDMQQLLSQYLGGRKILHIICEPNQMDILKQNSKRASNLKSSKTAIICLNNQKRYESIKEAAIDLGLDVGAISRCINNKQNSTKGYKFEKKK